MLERVVLPSQFAQAPPTKMDKLDKAADPHNLDNSVAAIDESLYSRQLYVLGEDAMKKMANTKILVSGISGVGLEIAKCLVLGGMKQVTLHDTKNLTMKDYSSFYYGTKDNIGENRAKCALKKISELNAYVKVDASDKPLDHSLLKEYNVVVFADDNLSKSTIDLIQWCHKENIKCICALSSGVFGLIFVDANQKFIVKDIDGNEPAMSFVENISHQDGEVFVMCLDDKRHGLSSGNYVKFSEIQGIPKLNQMDPVEITYISPISFKFKMEGLNKDDVYASGGIIKEIKMPKIVDFKSFSDSISNPEIMISDYGKMTNPQHILSLYITASELSSENEFSCDEKFFFEKYRTTLKNVVNFDDEPKDDLCHYFYHQYFKGQLAPMCAVIGSIAAQEAMKVCTGKFMPIKQWFAFDCIECIDKKSIKPESSSLESKILGSSIEKYLNELNIFLVGSGAIGCELLKLFGLMGVSKVGKGLLTVTDMDTIERSNLNRQFLFRPENIGHFKSDVASQAIKNLRPEFNVKSYTDAVRSDTETKFDYSFFKSQDVIANALDNLETRIYTDSKAVFFQIPLLESGTLGTKGNTQIVVPNLTESYSSSHDQPDQSFPMCTVKNFPYMIEHTIHWAKTFFENDFVLTSNTLSNFVKDKYGFLDSVAKMNEMNKTPLLNTMKKFLIEDKITTYADSVKKSFEIMKESFSNSILQLITIFPESHTTNSGTLFWSGLKRFPVPLELDIINNSEQFDFVESCAYNFCQLFGLKVPENNKSLIIDISKNYVFKEFVPIKSLKIAQNDAEMEQMEKNYSNSSNGGNSSAEIIEKLRSIDEKKLIINEIEFEKDDDSNQQIKLITAASNLRAHNYKIAPESFTNTKKIAGKIIPAIATTTSLVAGLISLELYKLHNYKESKIEVFKNSFISLALPFITQSEPMVYKKLSYTDSLGNNIEHNLWHKIEIDGELSLKEMLQKLKEEKHIDCSMISCGESLVYADFMPNLNLNNKERSDELVSTLIERSHKMKFDPKRDIGCMLEAICGDEDIPSIWYKFDINHPKWNNCLCIN